MTYEDTISEKDKTGITKKNTYSYRIIKKSLVKVEITHSGQFI